MKTKSSILGSSRRVISSRLDHVRHSLCDLRERLRTSVVQILSDNLGKLVRETFQETVSRGTPEAGPYPRPRNPSWDDDDDYYWGSPDPTSRWEEEYDHPYEEDHHNSAHSTNEPSSYPLSTALASGFRVVAWGLRHWTGTGSIVRIAGCGLVVACAAYFFGSLATVGLSLMEATDHLSMLG